MRELTDGDWAVVPMLMGFLEITEQQAVDMLEKVAFFDLSVIEIGTVPHLTAAHQKKLLAAEKLYDLVKKTEDGPVGG